MKYFSIKELCESNKADSLKINNQPSDIVKNNLVSLIEQILDPAREIYKKPIIVNSGYRCKQLNTAIKGAPTSQHLNGQAADITTGNKSGNKCLFEILKNMGGFDQLIDERNLSWIHVSYNKDNNRGQILYL